MHSTLAKKVEAVRRRGSRCAPETGRPVAALATSRFLPIIQAKLRIGAPNDKYEQEADRVANQVMSTPEPEPAMAGGLHGLDIVQRTCPACAGAGGLCPEGEEELQREPKEKEFRRETESELAPSVPAPLEANIRSVGGEGEPLTASQRNFFEPRFGTDFSAVRIHAGPAADELTKSLHARAFTVGSEVVFDPAEYNPESSAGLNLLAHELTHVVQQGYATPSPTRAARLRQTEPTVIQRQESGDADGASAKGGRKTPELVTWKFTITEDAPPLPSELRGKEKAYFLITYEPDEFHMFTDKPPGYDVSEKESIQDEMEYLKNAGYVVVYVERATENDVINAFADPQALLIFVCGHGDPPGVIRTTDEERVEPAEITIPAGSELSQVILENCNIGDQYEKWKEVLPRFSILTAWKGQTTTQESVQFNSGGGFSDQQYGSLMSRVKSLPILEDTEGGIIYQVTEKRVEQIEIKEFGPLP